MTVSIKKILLSQFSIRLNPLDSKQLHGFVMSTDKDGMGNEATSASDTVVASCNAG